MGAVCSRCLRAIRSYTGDRCGARDGAVPRIALVSHALRMHHLHGFEGSESEAINGSDNRMLVHDLEPPSDIVKRDFGARGPENGRCPGHRNASTGRAARLVQVVLNPIDMHDERLRIHSPLRWCGKVTTAVPPTRSEGADQRGHDAPYYSSSKGTRDGSFATSNAFGPRRLVTTAWSRR